MQKEYKDLQDFLDAIHDERSVREDLLSMGLVSEKNLRGSFISCPFHKNDKTPSLQLEEKFFKCYACDAKGSDVIKYLQMLKGLDFTEATLEYAEFLDCKIGNMKYQHNEMLGKLEQEWKFYQDSMTSAPLEIRRLQKQYFPHEIGYDPKLNYIVLALKNANGKVMGFTKRRINEEDMPKWKHSSLEGSMIGKIMATYNLDKATLEIKKTGDVIVTEGPKDVIAFARIGVNNCICTCGTSNSTNVIDIVQGLGLRRIILSQDSDKAGIKATIALIKHLIKLGWSAKQIFVLRFPDGKDPYDVVTESEESLKEILNNPTNSLGFLLLDRVGEVYSDFSNDNGKMLISDFLNLFNPIDKNLFIKDICKVKNLDFSEFEDWLLVKKDANNNSKDNKKNVVLAVINGDPIGENEVNELRKLGLLNNGIPDIEKIKKIARMKYGIK